MVDYDYILLGRFHTHFEYDPSATQVSMANDYYYANIYLFYGYSGSLQGITNETITNGNSQSVNGRYGLFYKNSSGIDSFGTNNYGVYVGSWSLISEIQSGSTQTFKPTTPSISARCSNTYFSTTSASAVDQTASYYEYVLELWRVDTQTSAMGGMEKTVRDMWINGF